MDAASLLHSGARKSGTGGSGVSPMSRTQDTQTTCCQGASQRQDLPLRSHGVGKRDRNPAPRCKVFLGVELEQVAEVARPRGKLVRQRWRQRRFGE